MPKDLNYSILLDYYGQMLTDKQRETLEYYYNEDLSLSEISEIVGTSRQGIMDIIKRSEQQLNSFEQKLCLKKHFSNINEAVKVLSEICNSVEDSEIKSKLTYVLNKLSD